MRPIILAVLLIVASVATAAADQAGCGAEEVETTPSYCDAYYACS